MKYFVVSIDVFPWGTSGLIYKDLWVVQVVQTAQGDDKIQANIM